MFRIMFVLGAVFACLGSLESLIPLVATPLSNFIYAQTLAIFPGAIYIALLPWYTLVLIVFM